MISARRLFSVALGPQQFDLRIQAVWGEGTASSSDGQRFGIQADSLLAAFYPRYFGYYDEPLPKLPAAPAGPGYRCQY